MVPRPAWWCAAVLLVASAASADTFLILPDGSGDFPAIQDAIDDAASGDAIVLGDGTFVGERNRNLDFLGKNLTLRSQSGGQHRQHRRRDFDRATLPGRLPQLPDRGEPRHGQRGAGHVDGGRYPVRIRH